MGHKMSPLYNYKCADGHITEVLVAWDRKAEHVKCSTCQKPAEPTLSGQSTGGRVSGGTGGGSKMGRKEK